MRDDVLAVRRYVARHHPGIPWGRVVREIGGLRNLASVLDDEGRPDPEELDEAVYAIIWRLIGKGRIP